LRPTTVISVRGTQYHDVSPERRFPDGADGPPGDERADVADAADITGEVGAADAAEPAEAAASEAFQALGGETRVGVLRTLADGEPRAFSELFAASDEDTSAGFAYHLRQLAGRFVRQRDDDRYELTDAGRAAVRAVESGAFTERVERDPVGLGEDCPLCGERALVASVTDNVSEVACESCGAVLMGLSLPPSGYADRDEEALPAALDATFRRRVGAFADGVCPDCAGTVEATTDAVVPAEFDGAGTTAGSEGDSADGVLGDDPVAVQAAFACETCRAGLRCPVTLTVLGHPAVAAFYHDHDRDPGERPVWNVGDEWRESLVSREPWCVRVSAQLDGEALFVYVADDGTVLGHRREAVAAVDAAGGDDRGGDDDPDGGESRPVGRPEAHEEAGVDADEGGLDHAAATDGATA
jgi:DNA-binding transcriptional ArsR family regulator